MKQSTNIEYWEEDKQVQEIIESAVEFQEMIEQKIANRPRKGTKIYNIWRGETNKMIEEYNTKFGKIYSKV